MPIFTKENSILERIRREKPDEYERTKRESVDNSYWVLGRILVEFYERDNPSRILYRLFNTRKEFGYWAESSYVKTNVRMLTIKDEILYPNETEGACCFCKR